MSWGLLIQPFPGRVIRRLFRVNFRVWKRFFWFHVALVWGREEIRLFSDLEIHPQLQACCQVNEVSLGGTRLSLWSKRISFLADYYGPTIAKSMPSVTPAAAYNFSFMEDISRDPIIECDLPWQDSRISSRWEYSDVSLSVSSIPLKFILSTKCSINFSKLGKGKLHCRAANILWAEQSQECRSSSLFPEEYRYRYIVRNGTEHLTSLLTNNNTSSKTYLLLITKI